MKNTAVVIPARLASTRLPEKCLLPLGRYSIIQSVYLTAAEAGFEKVIVACDSEKIAQEIRKIGGTALLTPPELKSGTDRIAYLLDQIEEEVIINVQGDEPFMKPEIIRAVAEPFNESFTVMMTTAAARAGFNRDIPEPSRVKVTVDNYGNALYFSRSLIPFPRENQYCEALLHLGIYGYRKTFLRQFSSWPQSLLEKTECLEQLRVLENGVKIRVVQVEYDGFGIDTEEDYQRALSVIEKERKNQ